MKMTLLNLNICVGANRPDLWTSKVFLNSPLTVDFQGDSTECTCTQRLFDINRGNERAISKS